MGAFKSHIRINWLNGKSGQNICKKLADWANKLVDWDSTKINHVTSLRLLVHCN